MEVRERGRRARWLELLAEYDRLGAALRRGFRSTAEWLAFECRMDGRTARDHVRVARRLEELPLIAEAFALGQLSYTQVRALSRAEVVEDERALLAVARRSTAHQLEQHVRRLRSAESADLDVAERTRAKRYLRHEWAEDGSLRVWGRLPVDGGAALVEALETRAAAIHGEDGDPGRPDGWCRPGIGARRADALVDLVTGGGVETQVVLHADPQALACAARGDEPRGGRTLFLREGPAIPSELARRLTCDAMVTVDGLNLGRTTRVVTPAQRRALEARDGRVCSMPGCCRTHGLDAHHLIHWIHGGRTDLDNLALFCHAHHHLLHEQGWRARRRRDGTLVVADPSGRELHRFHGRASPPLVAAA